MNRQGRESGLSALVGWINGVEVIDSLLLTK